MHIWEVSKILITQWKQIMLNIQVNNRAFKTSVSLFCLLYDTNLHFWFQMTTKGKVEGFAKRASKKCK